MAKTPGSTLWWAGTVALFYFALIVVGSASSLSADDIPVKAALVALVKDNDINATLFSIKEFDDKFNNRFLHDWVFFSVQDLSEAFKDSVTNATNATCIFEVIPEENWNDPGWVDLFQHSVSTNTNLGKGSAALNTIANIHQMNRWISAPFAKERCLKDYEWFLKVDPGVSTQSDKQLERCGR
jgi:alpha 1,2-mannosyltransferase